MTKQDHTKGVEETAVPWEAAVEPLRARPVAGPVDWDALIDRIHRDFPKTLARLAE